LTCACLGYALVRGGQSVLMVDADPGTDGLSLFLLGKEGQRQVQSFDPENTFVGTLVNFKENKRVAFRPRLIHRRGDDHGVTYDAIISGKSLYGEQEELTRQLAVPDLDRATFREAIRYQFDQLRTDGEFDYVLVDTRGGFALESTDICALADSFIVVTEPDFTSFYQDRNLLKRINHAAGELSSPSVLRAIIVNKATDVLKRDDRPYLENLEVSFRAELEREFPIRFDETYPVPVDIEALLAYKVQKIPYVTAPGSLFSFATLAAFSSILQIVTSQWSKEQVDKWNELVDRVSAALHEKERLEEQRESEKRKRETEWEGLQKKLQESDATIAALKDQLAEQKRALESERQRSDTVFQLFSPLNPQAASSFQAPAHPQVPSKLSSSIPPVASSLPVAAFAPGPSALKAGIPPAAFSRPAPAYTGSGPGKAREPLSQPAKQRTFGMMVVVLVVLGCILLLGVGGYVVFRHIKSSGSTSQPLSQESSGTAPATAPVAPASNSPASVIPSANSNANPAPSALSNSKQTTSTGANSLTPQKGSPAKSPRLAPSSTLFNFLTHPRVSPSSSSSYSQISSILFQPSAASASNPNAITYSDIEQITTALSFFYGAYNAHNVNLMQGAWKGMKPEQASQFGAFFKEQPTATISYQCSDLKSVSSNTATCTCVETTTISSGGKPQSDKGPFQFTFNKDANGWFIADRR
jgi:cellulose biosynthesis protein BcsQ/uncharacterized coiled-coil protein SlyX